MLGHAYNALEMEKVEGLIALIGEGLRPGDFARRAGEFLIENSVAEGCELKAKGEAPVEFGSRTAHSLTASSAAGTVKVFFRGKPGGEEERMVRLLSCLLEQAMKVHELVTQEKEELVEENIELRQALSAQCRFENIVGVSSAMQAVFEKITLVSQTSATVIIYGETGTGKELVATAIHCNSARANGPFVKVNCAALPEHLVESELFGHIRGAFTGAIADRKGRFELADGGTLFLDEVADIPLSTQVKLLRFLQEREFEKVGDTQVRSADVRIIAATNKNLAEEVEKGGFREDLYFRLNVIPIQIPPLRERKEDIPPLVDYFLRKYNRQNLKNVWKVPKETLDAIIAYDWYGNVRELEAYIERAVVLATGEELSAELLPTFVELSRAPRTSSLEQVIAELYRIERFSGSNIFRELIERVERVLIEETMKDTGFNQSETARRLGINRNTLHKKLKRYRITCAEEAK